MSVAVKLNGQELTNIRSLVISLSLRSGIVRTDPSALRVHFTRQVGMARDAKADQLTFATIKGESSRAGIKPQPAQIELTDDNGGGVIGIWNLGASFVESYVLDDSGDHIIESTVLRAKDVTYARDGGPETAKLKI